MCLEIATIYITFTSFPECHPSLAHGGMTAGREENGAIITLMQRTSEELVLVYSMDAQ